jgi:hypothetical protein
MGVMTDKEYTEEYTQAHGRYAVVLFDMLNKQPKTTL